MPPNFASKQAFLQGGLGAVTVSSLPTDDQNCSICTEPYSAGETPVRLPCTHVFGRNCITRWFEENNNCPVCRSEFFPRGPRPFDREAYADMLGHDIRHRTQGRRHRYGGHEPGMPQVHEEFVEVPGGGAWSRSYTWNDDDYNARPGRGEDRRFPSMNDLWEGLAPIEEEIHGRGAGHGHTGRSRRHRDHDDPPWEEFRTSHGHGGYDPMNPMHNTGHHGGHGRSSGRTHRSHTHHDVDPRTEFEELMGHGRTHRSHTHHEVDPRTEFNDFMGYGRSSTGRSRRSHMHHEFDPMFGLLEDNPGHGRSHSGRSRRSHTHHEFDPFNHFGGHGAAGLFDEPRRSHRHHGEHSSSRHGESFRPPPHPFMDWDPLDTMGGHRESRREGGGGGERLARAPRDPFSFLRPREDAGRSRRHHGFW